MKRNMGKADKVIRIFFGIIIVGLFLEGQISGPGAVLLLVIASFFLITSFLSYCPLYIPFRISTRKKNSDVADKIK